MPYGRFEIHNAIHALVGLGFARPVTGSELSELALEVMQAGEKAKGRTLLEHALELERNNLELRRLLAELLEDLGEEKEAAACWAVIGYQENVNQREAEALAAYERAATLDPTDIGLLERHHEIVGRCGDTAQFEAATLQLSKRLLEHGLMERAIDAVTRGMDRPDLADRPALLEHLIEIYSRAGRPEDGLEMLSSAASKAERLGDRERAIAILEIGVAAMPDQPELAARLEDVMTSRRQRKRRLIRRIVVFVVVLVLVGFAGLVTVEEFGVQNQMAPAIKDLPMAIHEDRATENLKTLKNVLDSHWLAPSLASVQVLVDGLATVELERTRVAAEGYRFDDALERIRKISTILGDHPAMASLEQLRARCMRGRDFMKRFEGWLISSEASDPKNPEAFQFYETDVRGILEMQHKLNPEAAYKVRQKIAVFGAVEALPLFTQLYLAGGKESEEKFGDNQEMSLLEVVKGMAKRAMARHKQLVDSGSKLAGNTEAARAWELIVAAYALDKPTPNKKKTSKQLAVHLIPTFIGVPKEWPEDPEVLRKLFKQ